MFSNYIKYILLSIAICTSQLSAYAHKPVSISGAQKDGYALIISIGRYPLQPAWATANSDLDIQHINTFIDKLALSTSIDTLQDEEATKNNIITALKKILKNCTAGQYVYVHFSGAGFQVPDASGKETDGKEEVFMPYDAPSVADVYDAVMRGEKPDLSTAITDDELISIIQEIRTKIGDKGQFFFSVDASHFGPENTDKKTLIGRGGFLEIEHITATGKAPFIMLTSCLDKEESQFLGGGDTLTRSFSLALRTAVLKFSKETNITYTQLFQEFQPALSALAPNHTPSLAGNSATDMVFNNAVNIQNETVPSQDLPLHKNGQLFILSIGISSYNGPYAFANCDDDARLFESLMTKSFKQEYGAASSVYSWLLLDKNANRKAILDAINEIIAASKDDDVFAFFFAGFTNQSRQKNGLYGETWFYPSITSPVDFESRNGVAQDEVLTLSQLKKLFDYIKSDRQLLFTEAGPSENFKREFVRSMIKTNPILAEIRKRNRVILVPDEFGWDELNCKGQAVQHGPGLFFFSQLVNNGTSVFQLFHAKEADRNDFIYKYRQAQFECGYKKQYINFFFEKQFVEDLQYYFTKDALPSVSRGADDDTPLSEVVHIGNKYALVIGTNKFSNWSALGNAENDAKSVSDTLQNLFGFKTKLLINPTQKDVFNALYRYSSLLTEKDQFVLYIAGHGYYDTAMFRDGYIVTTDSKSLKADTFLTSYLPFDLIRTVTDNYKAKQVMVLLDVCFSGAFDESEETLGGGLQYSLTGKLNELAVNNKLKMTTRKYITAGSKTEKVLDDYNGQHSPFAYFLLEGLRRAAKEKQFLSSGMLFKFIQSYIDDTVPLQAGFGKDQQKSGSEFIFIIGNN